MNRAAQAVEDDHHEDGGGGSSGSEPSQPKDGVLTLPAGQAGEVSLGDAVQIFIPANATEQEIKLTIQQLQDTQNLLQNGGIF
ncbi:hypothetical protein ACFPES_30370 [Paenibacillus sp. GCM10023248]|uniref:hypothetical protein n=1 Tax=unclassified Paenibacillus TaxID=185978 RepID=UPI002378442A|nr:hypothetical protein [Paenibacillus sp. MAHUQ-63]MDD9271349.1 hypothetical protein [Paenibacillus sp. MAHUQ-63]